MRYVCYEEAKLHSHWATSPERSTAVQNHRSTVLSHQAQRTAPAKPKDWRLGQLPHTNPRYNVPHQFWRCARCGSNIPHNRC